jgi:hypothetical protein
VSRRYTRVPRNKGAVCRVPCAMSKTKEFILGTEDTLLLTENSILTVDLFNFQKLLNVCKINTDVFLLEVVQKFE